MASALALDVGRRVKQARKERGLTVRELEALSGLRGSGRISKIEHGRAVSIENLAAIARGLGVDLKELLP